MRNAPDKHARMAAFYPGADSPVQPRSKIPDCAAVLLRITRFGSKGLPTAARKGVNRPLGHDQIISASRAPRCRVAG